MKTASISYPGKTLNICLSFLAAALSLQAATARYVNVNSTNPVPPFTDWSTAATNIQDAVDAAAAGDEIVVTNGVYATGGRAVGTNLLVNRVAVDKPLTVRSVNGPEVTVIRGYQVPGTTNGDGAIRCVYLTNGAVLTGFTLTGGATRTTGPYYDEQSGGGVRAQSDDAAVSNCVVSGNSAYLRGGAAYYGTFLNCAISGNIAGQGGGLYRCTARNCTLTGNTSTGLGGGGASQGTLNNCIVYYNKATMIPFTDNYQDGTLTYCCTFPLPIAGGGNFTQEPQLASSSRLSAGSPCVGAGASAYSVGADLDGDPWNNPPSIGCDELQMESTTGPLDAVIASRWTRVAVGFAAEFQAVITGRALASAWDFGDGTVVSNRAYASHAWNAPGQYPVVLRVWNIDNLAGISTTTSVQVVESAHFVSLNSSSPTPPFISWETAATNIQQAVDAATVPGALVLVTNGVYSSGGRVIYGAMTNRVAVTNPIIVRSVNGPLVTTIQGRQLPTYTNGDGAVRCAYLSSGAILSGFTLTKGATRSTGYLVNEGNGGAVWCESGSAVVSNCVLTGNSAYSSGGGAYHGTLKDCSIAFNSAINFNGGGVGYNVTMYNCRLISNSAASSGGAAYNATLINCTVARNSSKNSRGGVEGAYSTVLNSVLYYNTGPQAPANYENYTVTLYGCCTYPLPPTGSGNITNDPSFLNLASGDLRLQTNSPCINSGNNGYTPGATDLDGNPRIVGGTVDIGAYEFQSPASQLSYAWLQQYGLPTDGSADFTDTDGDRANNWQEWQCATVPTNALSALRLLTPSTVGTNLLVSWESVSSKSYFLERSTSLGTNASFLPLATNLLGQSGTTTFTDTNAAGAGPRFYRVGVQY